MEFSKEFLFPKSKLVNDVGDGEIAQTTILNEEREAATMIETNAQAVALDEGNEEATLGEANVQSIFDGNYFFLKTLTANNKRPN